MTTLGFQWRWFTLNLANKFGVNFIEVCPRWPIDDKSTLVQVMALQQSGDKPLRESGWPSSMGLSEWTKNAWLACTQGLKYHIQNIGDKNGPVAYWQYWYNYIWCSRLLQDTCVYSQKHVLHWCRYYQLLSKHLSSTQHVSTKAIFEYFIRLRYFYFHIAMDKYPIQLVANC